MGHGINRLSYPKRRDCTVYYLPAWVPASDYVKLVTDMGLQDVRSEDWSTYVLPFWPAVIRSALLPTNFIKMLRSGMMTIKGAIASVSGAAVVRLTVTVTVARVDALSRWIYCT